MPQQENTYADHQPGLAPPRFRLRTLLVLVALLCVCLATFVAVGPIMGSALLLGLMAVFAHVAGNAIGSQLRQSGSRPLADERGIPSDGPARRLSPDAHHFAPQTRLSRRVPLGWFMRVMTSLGSILGAVAGGMFLTSTSVRPLSYSTILFGCVATGVLGGLFAFWTFSLMQVFLMAWWQAHWHGHKKRR